MSLIKKISGAAIKDALSGTTRQYLAGNLKRPHDLQHVYHEGVEVGITKYTCPTTEAPHTHSIAYELQLMITGRTAYLDMDTGAEHVFVSGDFYVIEPGFKYAQKSDAGTEILFIKTPSIDDKILIENSAEVYAWFNRPIEQKG